jgi:6-phosphogluconolactonase
MNRRRFLTGVSAAFAASRLPLAGASSRYWLYLGTRSGDKGEGIHRAAFDSATGECGPIGIAAEVPFPTSMTPSADGRFLYSVSEVGNDGKSEGGLFSFAIDHANGGLKPINHVSAGGGGTTWVALDRTGRTAILANFGTGNTTAFRVRPDGSLGEQTASMAHSGKGPHRRQTGPHAHWVTFSPDNRYVFVPDLGADKIFVFRFDASTGKLSAADPPTIDQPAGSGPRQVAFHRNHHTAFLMDELTAKIAVFDWDAKKRALHQKETISAMSPEDKAEPSGAAIAMHPNGKFLFTTTRSDNMVVTFRIDGDGKLEPPRRTPTGGKTPWSCAIDPTGRWLFVMNLDSNNVTHFRVDPATGELAPAGQPLSMPLPVTATFVAA